MNWMRLIHTLTAVGVLSQSSLFSWGNSTPKTAPSSDIKGNYPFDQDQQWYTEESYLFWKPAMENMWYGNTDSFEILSTNVFQDRIKVKEPEYKWSSGVRVGLGRYLPNHDGWDTSATATFFYSDMEDRTSANLNKNVGFNSSYSFNNFGVAELGRFDWRLNYWTVDLIVGRLFQMTEQIVFHPYVGLRGSWQYQEAGSKISKVVDVGTTQTLRIKLDNDFWGVGPRFGTNFIYYFENHLSFLANVSASLLVGRQKLKNNQKLTTSPFEIEFTPTNIQSHDSLSVIRTNLEGMIGLGWESWLRNQTVRIAPSICLEGSLWFAMNQLYNIYPTTNQFDNIEQRRHGNLGLMGVSFNLQVDF